MSDAALSQALTFRNSQEVSAAGSKVGGTFLASRETRVGLGFRRRISTPAGALPTFGAIEAASGARGKAPDLRRPPNSGPRTQTVNFRGRFRGPQLDSKLSGPGIAGERNSRNRLFLDTER